MPKDTLTGVAVITSHFGLHFVFWPYARKAQIARLHLQLYFRFYVLSPTYFPCRRTELIVSLERGVCSCAELQVFSYYRGWKEACQATRAIQQHGDATCHQVYFFLQGKAPKEIHVVPHITS